MHVHPHSSSGDGFEERRAQDARHSPGDDYDDIDPVGLARTIAQPIRTGQKTPTTTGFAKRPWAHGSFEVGRSKPSRVTRLSRNVSWAHQDCIGLAESQLDAIGPGRGGRTVHGQVEKFRVKWFK